MPDISDRRVLEKEVDSIRALIASGRVAWPPPVLDLTRDPDEAVHGDVYEMVPREFDWRHPRAFVRLDTIKRMERERLDDLTAEGHPALVAGDFVRQGTYQIYMQAMWAHHGRRVYRLDSGLTELLLQTKLPRIPAATLRFPLNGFLLALPEGRFATGVESDPEPQPVDGIMIAVNRVDGDTDEVREMTLLISCRSPRGPVDDNVVWHGFAIEPGANLDEIEANLGSGPTKDLLDNALRLSLGLVLYLQSEHPALEPVPPPKRVNLDGIQNAGKRRKAQHRYDRVSKLGFVWVGRHEGAGVANLQEAVNSANGAWSLDHQVWVSGHWRDQPYGPKSSLRRPRWIKPYIKGPDMADTMRINAKRIQAARSTTRSASKGQKCP